MKHTPEPWIDDGYYNIFCEHSLITHESIVRCNIRHDPTRPINQLEARANARRIVACVTACTGIPTEALETGVIGEMAEALRLADMELNDLRSVLYGQNYQVAGWHMNGALEPIDNIFDGNNFGAADKVRNLLSRVRPEGGE